MAGKGIQAGTARAELSGWTLCALGRCEEHWGFWPHEAEAVAVADAIRGTDDGWKPARALLLRRMPDGISSIWLAEIRGQKVAMVWAKGMDGVRRVVTVLPPGDTGVASIDKPRTSGRKGHGIDRAEWARRERRVARGLRG